MLLWSKSAAPGRCHALAPCAQIEDALWSSRLQQILTRPLFGSFLSLLSHSSFLFHPFFVCPFLLFFLLLSSTLFSLYTLSAILHYTTSVTLPSLFSSDLQLGVREPPGHAKTSHAVSENVLESKKKLHGLSPWTNYTDRATAACRRSDCQLLLIEGVTWSAWLNPTAVFSVF
jgi:hypothetical protein